MAYTAKVILDSIHPDNGTRLTTMVVTYPRIVHDELLTHRVFSRNAASTRAVPIAKQIQALFDDPYIPESWGRNQKGMAAGPEIVHPETARVLWLDGRDNAVALAQQLAKLGVHKEGVSPLLMPFQWITTIVTATEWNNFFRLRCAPDARPPMQRIATMIRDAYDNSEPQRRRWHLPFVREDEEFQLLGDKIVASVARCARVSYLNHEGQASNTAQDTKLFNQLLADRHLSPFEHQAWGKQGFEAHEWSGNFRGWQQYRKDIEVLGQ